jgi:hypothetical protein
MPGNNVSIIFTILTFGSYRVSYVQLETRVKNTKLPLKLTVHMTHEEANILSSSVRL